MKISRRFDPQSKAGRSHYQFKNWSWDKFGKKSAYAVRPAQNEHPDLIHTCFKNPSKGTETMYCLVLDLDAHRAERKWKTKAGKLRWSLIRKFLLENHPELLSFIFATVCSTGGNGLALYFAISPLELVKSTRSAQIAAKALQDKLVILFNRYGLGADPAARGLQRDFCNWQNPEKREYENLLLLKAIQSEKTPVVSQLLEYLKQFKISTYTKKSEKKDPLYPDIRAEKKLSQLYIHLHEKYLEDEKNVSMATKEITELTGLSRPFVEKFLKSPTPWLKTEYCGREDGWVLTISLEQQLTQRAQELLLGVVESTNDFSGALKRSHFVQDGERNLWITKAALILKHHGIPLNAAIELISSQITNIPDHEASRNCKDFKKIIRSLYSSRPDLFGVTPGRAPEWLLREVEAPNKQAVEAKKKLMQINLKKGGYPHQCSLRKISRDQCLVFERNYYSVPKSFVGQEVLVFRWEDKIRIYEQFSQKHIVTHEVIESGKGQYQFLENHFEHFGPLDLEYLYTAADSFERYGIPIHNFACNLVKKYQKFSIRRLWAFSGLINEFGRKTVSEAVQYSTNLGQLSRKCKQLSRRFNNACNS